MSRTPADRPNQRGFTLIEVLITVVILAIGLLGVASLQFMSKRTNFEAAQRTTASMLAYDLIERMRSNPKGLKIYAGSKENPPDPLGNRYPDEPDPKCNSASFCAENDLADHDLWEWEQALKGAAEQNSLTGANSGGLALPTACVTTTVGEALANRSGRYTVVIAWRGMTKLSDPENPADPDPDPDPYACGRDTGNYDDDDGNKNAHRRILVIDTYIADIAET